MSPTESTSQKGYFERGLIAPRKGYSVLVIVAITCLLAILSLGQAVLRDLRLLEYANSDNVQWTLSQAEVEYLNFEKILDHALADSSADKTQIVTAFDVFYSRINTLENGVLYAELRMYQDFSVALRKVRLFLNASVPTIDTIKTASETELRALQDASVQIAETVRRLANSGLYYFAAQSDQRRNSIAVTLQRLALATTALIAALALLTYYSHRMGQNARRSSRALQDAYLRLNTVVDASLDAVIVSDWQGRVLDFNAAAERIFGYRFKDIEGQKLSDIIIPPSMRQAHDAGIERMNDSGEKHVIGKGRVKLTGMRANGDEFPVELALESAGTGRDRIVIGFVRDISTRVAAEAELVNARDQALAGEKAKSEFLAMMTHEIRTPLNGVIGNLSLLEETRLNQRQQKYVKNMGISARLLMDHVNTVLDIARFESGLIAVAEKPTHLGRLMQDIVDGQSGHAAANGNTLQWSWEGVQENWVKADAARLQQILLNLVGNAIKFTQDGRIALEAERLPKASAPGRVALEFRVIDTGIGIADADQDRIFEDFQSVDSSFQRRTGGTGLGLGIVRRLVTAMGGTLGVESTLGEGSVFWLRLEFDRAEAPKTTRKDKQTQAGSDPLDVLVVEDNEVNLHLVREMLELQGHRVTVAMNGLDGVNESAAHRYDLILMDISMPVMDGLQACRAIRAGEGLSRDCPIIALSANVLPEMRDRIVDAGMSGFLGKPLQLSELRTLLAEIGAADPDPEPAAPVPSPADDILAGLQVRFRAETDELFSWLETDPQDRSEIAARCHKVAGSAAAFGHLPLRDALVQIETAATRNDTSDDLTPLVAKAKALWLTAAAAPHP